MKPYFIKTPNWIRKLYSNFIWSFTNSKKEIYLTFDDGPTPEITEWVLEILRKFNAKATFFCIGKNIKNHPEIFKKIIKEGHSIGNHTHNHLNGWKINNARYIENILETNNMISTLSMDSQGFFNHKNLNLFRPPYGKIKRRQSKELIKRGFKIIMWDVLSADFDQSITKEKCLKNVVDAVENGSIIIFHDSVKAEINMKYTLPKILELFDQKGFEFKTIILKRTAPPG
jgi:peptidoglycan/xylan/chitin deacetylase (PgdA/CDA1 family)